MLRDPLQGATRQIPAPRLNPEYSASIIAAVKDRPALAMIEAAEASGELTPEKTIIEATSGNTGIGLAMVCAVKGYRLLLTMPESASLERKRILKAMGAELLLTPAHLGTDGSIEEVYRMARENPAVFTLGPQPHRQDGVGGGPEKQASGLLSRRDVLLRHARQL